MVETKDNQRDLIEEELSVKVYLDVLEDIGPKLYTGKDTWIREYIQNSTDSGAKSVKLRFTDDDLTISDDGAGMNMEELYREAFSIGGSKKDEKKIGELGIGMYAAIGICDRMVVLTKKINEEPYEAVFESTTYRDLVNGQEVPTFEEGMKKIFKVNRSKIQAEPLSHYTHIRFERLNISALENFSFYRINDLIEKNINVSISEDFKHKQNVMTLLGKDESTISISFYLDGVSKEIERFSNLRVKFSDTFLHDELKLKGKTVAKVWAVYPEDGTSFVGNRLLLKHKGMVVGDSTVVKSRFKVEVSPRFLGEIVFLSPSLQINTERNWFVETKELEETVKLAKEFLGKLDYDAEFDTKYGNGLVRALEQQPKIEEKLKKAKKEKNYGTVQELERKKENLERRVEEKVTQAKSMIQNSEKNTGQNADPHEQLRTEIIRKTLREITEKKGEDKSRDDEKDIQKERRNPIPELVKTIVMRYVDEELAPRIKKKNFKDTSQNAYSFIEDLLREKLGINATPYSSGKYYDLVEKFLQEYEPPFDLEEKDEKNFTSSLEFILRGSHFFFRNPSSHTNKLDEMDDPRFILQSVFVADFLVYLIRLMVKRNNGSAPLDPES